MLPRPILDLVCRRLDEMHERCCDGDTSPTTAHNCATGLKAGYYAVLLLSALIDALLLFGGWVLFGGDANVWLAVALFAGAALISLIVSRPILAYIETLGPGAANDR